MRDLRSIVLFFFKYNLPHIIHTSFKYRPIFGRESSGNQPLYDTSEEKTLGPDKTDIRLHIEM
jgi:hypothetical protein